ncbi:MAG: sulfotransferase, partial [Gammaproteobacteria bacterium]|nr:sulfotransferase [Gammaproteobacteria bacterium]
GQRAPEAVLKVVDKQPLNFWHLGLVAMAFPNARIVHCTRDIRDCGLSIFTQNFNTTQNWSTDLDDIAFYWQGYKKLMEHFKQVSGLPILEVNYEETVSELEWQSRRLLDFVGLPWDECVLNFHQSQRAVQTPSRWQVRQPLYQSSKARWRNYESYLAPLMNAVEAQ